MKNLLESENYSGKIYPYLFSFPGSSSAAGSLNFWENCDLFPLGIQRCFWISNVGKGETRGNHAHYQESQVLLAIAGALHIEVTNLKGKNFYFDLDSADQGLYIPPLHWVIVHFEPDAVLLGMSDRKFSDDDFIRDKKYFESLQQATK